MTVCSEESFEFPALKTSSTKRKIEFKFSGGEVTSDGGVLILRDIDRTLGLTKEFSKQPVKNIFISSSSLTKELTIKVLTVCTTDSHRRKNYD